MKKNRLIAAVAAAALVISGLAGCGSSASTESAQTVPAGTETESSVQKSSEAVNKTGYPIMNEDYTFKIVYAVGSTDKIGGWENKDFQILPASLQIPRFPFILIHSLICHDQQLLNV